ncbi:MAG: hypothetical protein M3Q56_10670 [Bacteroidota bacterium]|nr:hypothetical protein [Bacteroidota bacterium]
MAIIREFVYLLLHGNTYCYGGYPNGAYSPSRGGADSLAIKKVTLYAILPDRQLRTKIEILKI